jgi:hypothetical protein
MDAGGVGKDACHYAGGKVQCGAACCAVGYRLPAGFHGVDEGLQFGAERFGGWGGQFFESEFGLRAGAFNADTESVAACVVERNIFVLLEEAHFADPFSGDAAGGDVGDRDADGFYFGDGFFDDGEKNVEVVDHQVEDYVNIEATWSENAEAVDFKKKRSIDDRFDSDYGGIEAFDVANLQDALMVLGDGN